ncbi:MAG: hypothetical protein AB8G17_21255 [Gammaproteobacteria bacterium]
MSARGWVLITGLVTTVFVLMLARLDAPKTTAPSATFAATDSQTPGTHAAQPVTPAVSISPLTDCDSTDNLLLPSALAEDPTRSDAELQVKWRERHRRAVNVLDHSDSPRQRVSALRLQEDPASDQQILRLAESVAQQPDDPVLAAELFDLCNGRLASNACARFDTPSMLIRADPDNGHTWFRLAVHYANSSDDDATLDALQRVATAPVYDSGVPQMLSQIELDLRSADSSMSYLERFFSAVGGIAKGGPTGYSPLFSQCKALSTNSERWRSACTQAAKRVAADRSTTMQSVLGLSLQAAVEKAVGQPEKSALTMARTEAVYAVGRQQHALEADRLLANDPKVLEQYIDAWLIDGELAAQTQLVATVEAAIERGDLRRCRQN